MLIRAPGLHFFRARGTEDAQPRTPAGSPRIPAPIFICQGGPQAHGPFLRTDERLPALMYSASQSLDVYAEALLIATGQDLKRLLRKRGWGRGPHTWAGLWGSCSISMTAGARVSRT